MNDRQMLVSLIDVYLLDLSRYQTSHSHISTTAGNEKDDGTHENYVSAGRTSENAWCVEDCYEDPIAQRVMQRIENITGIPDANSENLQLLRYEKSQL